LIAAFAFAGINKYLENWFADEFVLTYEFEAWSLLYKYGWMYLYNFCFRTFYYSAFMLQNGALIASGFGYNGFDEKTKEARWDTVVSIYLWKVETGDSAIKIL
jgi:lysophospholipid acyltransferase